MKSILTGIVLMIAISVIAWGVWETQSTTSAGRYTSAENVRLN